MPPPAEAGAVVVGRFMYNHRPSHHIVELKFVGKKSHYLVPSFKGIRIENRRRGCHAADCADYNAPAGKGIFLCAFSQLWPVCR